MDMIFKKKKTVLEEQPLCYLGRVLLYDGSA